MSDKIPQRIMDEAAKLYPIDIIDGSPDAYGEVYDRNKYERNAYIAGRMKSDGELVIEFAEWMLIHASMYYYDGWNWLHNDGMLSSTELYTIFLQSKQNK